MEIEVWNSLLREVNSRDSLYIDSSNILHEYKIPSSTKDPYNCCINPPKVNRKDFLLNLLLTSRMFEEMSERDKIHSAGAAKFAGIISEKMGYSLLGKAILTQALLKHDNGGIYYKDIRERQKKLSESKRREFARTHSEIGFKREIESEEYASMTVHGKRVFEDLDYMVTLRHHDPFREYPMMSLNCVIGSLADKTDGIIGHHRENYQQTVRGVRILISDLERRIEQEDVHPEITKWYIENFLKPIAKEGEFKVYARFSGNLELEILNRELNKTLPDELRGLRDILRLKKDFDGSRRWRVDSTHRILYDLMKDPENDFEEVLKIRYTPNFSERILRLSKDIYWVREGKAENFSKIQEVVEVAEKFRLKDNESVHIEYAPKRGFCFQIPSRIGRIYSFPGVKSTSVSEEKEEYLLLELPLTA